MKKLKDKMLKKRKQEQIPARITNETVAEHRERILAGGRKFKYPVQYARHRLVINTIIISIGVVIFLIALGWWQLYPAQNTSNFMYRVTQFLPLPVASVDGETVRYSDYLMRYRSSVYFLQQQNMISVNTEDGQRQLQHIKRQSMDEAIANAYAKKLAREYDVTVSNDEVNEFIHTEREAQQPSLSEGAYETVVLRGFYDWSMGEYRDIVRGTLLKRKVSFAIDESAKQKADDIRRRVNSDNFADVAREVSDDQATKANGGDVGFVPEDSHDANGLVQAASRLAKNRISPVIEGTDGYYIVKPLEKSNGQIRYARIKIALTEFDKRLEQIRSEGRIEEFINIPSEEAGNGNA